MLIISREKDQKIVVADEIEITILEVGRNRVRFGIKAPKHIPILTRHKGDEPVESPAVRRAPQEVETEAILASAEEFVRRRAG